MSTETFNYWAFPIAAVVLSAFSFAVVLYGSWRFHRQYPDSPK